MLSDRRTGTSRLDAVRTDSRVREARREQAKAPARPTGPATEMAGPVVHRLSRGRRPGGG